EGVEATTHRVVASMHRVAAAVEDTMRKVEEVVEGEDTMVAKVAEEEVLVDGSRIDHRPQRDGRKEEVVGESKGRGRSVHRGNGSLYIDIAIAAQASSLAKTSS
ncbi:unnamed protein product, partial [Durusdinium trenchii]